VSGSPAQKTRRRHTTRKKLATAVDIDFQNAGFRVRLSDGRVLDLTYEQFDFLRRATPVQRAKGIVWQKGTALWWQDLLDGISVAGLTGVSETELEKFAGLY
jgi:uncharacterized protein DUF2442